MARPVIRHHGMKWKIRRGDRVQVICGRDKGKRGDILAVDKKRERVLVQGVQMVKRHQKQSVQSQGGIEEKESYIHVSNVALIDPKEDKPTRTGVRFLQDGGKKRFARKSGEIID